MSSTSPTSTPPTSARATLAALTRWRRPDDPQLVDARQRCRRAYAVAEVDRLAARLTDADRLALAALLSAPRVA